MVRRLLHVRGGVSGHSRRSKDWYGSSPRPWRCFHCRANIDAMYIVFSTSVEVFPYDEYGNPVWGGLLHVRGGVSRIQEIEKHLPQSSPRPWRCFRCVLLPAVSATVFSTSVEVFLLDADGKRWIGVFSTSVEVFLHCHLILTASPGLLHVRGGVSFVPIAAKSAA